MKCLRCNGQMRKEHFSDFSEESGRFAFEGWRCLNCGEILDPLILEHRHSPPLYVKSRKRRPVVPLRLNAARKRVWLKKDKQNIAFK